MMTSSLEKTDANTGGTTHLAFRDAYLKSIQHTDFFIYSRDVCAGMGTKR